MSKTNSTLNDYLDSKTDKNFFFVEPTPDWMTALQYWKWGWALHIYGFAVLFFAVSFSCLIVAFVFRHRLLRHKFIAVTLSFTCLACISRGTFHVVDPYGYFRRIPVIFTRLFYQIAFPCITTSFGLIQLIIYRITMLDVGNNRLQSLPFLAGVTATYFMVIVVTEIAIFCKKSTRPMLLLSEGYFIVWAIFLCVTFIYSGFRLTHYTTEAKKARKELSSYSLSRRSPDGDAFKTLAMQRLYNPKIKMTDVSKRTFSLVSSDSNSSLSRSTQEKENKNERGRRKFSLKTNCVEKSSRIDSCGTVHFNVEFDDRSLLDTSSDSAVNNTFLRELQNNSSIFIINESDYINRNASGSRTNLNSFACEEMSDQVKEETVALKNNMDYNGSFVFDKETLTIDNGYMADCEVINNLYGDDKLRDKSQTIDDLPPDSSFPVIQNNLPDNPSSLSLYRIRQSGMLHKVVQLTYGISFMLIVACVFQLYAMFGVYGVLGSHVIPEPWPWFTFQTFFRCVELGLTVTTTIVIYIIIGHKTYKAHRKKKRNPSTKNDCFFRYQ